MGRHVHVLDELVGETLFGSEVASGEGVVVEDVRDETPVVTED